MKRLVATLMVLTVLSIPVMPANDAILDPKMYQLCHDKEGRFVESKDCIPQPNGCGCLFHEIAEFFGDIFG